MTDLPFGRGGSPMQNLIVRGYKKTMISAIKVEEEIDTGPIYMKYPLELYGTADEILKRASNIIFKKLIPHILENQPLPVPQEGEIVHFQRRSLEDGELNQSMSLETIYDYIRMLDGEGYPKAFLKIGKYTITFSSAELKEEAVLANVEIRRDEK